MGASSTIELFDEDPELLDSIPPSVRHRVRLKAPLVEVKGRGWDHSVFGPKPIACVVIRGAVAKETLVPGERSIELLGPGDVLIPAAPDDSHSIPSGVCWEALGSSYLGVLKRGLLKAPEVASPLLVSIASRLNEQAHRTSVQAAIAGLHPIERRLEFLLWHLADRWGRRGPTGVTLRIKLTQRTLAALAGTERSTICRSLIELEDRQVIARLPGKQIQLLAEPPGERLIDLAIERIGLT